jgi:hypothetical protein
LEFGKSSVDGLVQFEEMTNGEMYFGHSSGTLIPEATAIVMRDATVVLVRNTTLGGIRIILHQSFTLS